MSCVNDTEKGSITGWREASDVYIPEIKGYAFIGHDDCTKNLPCYWYDFVDGKLVKAKESEYPFYAFLYVELPKREETGVSAACGEGHVINT